MIGRGRLVALACLSLWAMGGTAAAAASSWTTYHHDGARSGIDPDSTSPVAPRQIWQSTPLDGDVYAEPLVYGSTVYVATENNTVYALDASSGAIVWQKHLATAVPSNQLPCGNITPAVGITSTPVIDPSRERIYVVADTWSGSPQHLLFGLSLTDGSFGPGASVDPPGSTPSAQLQRAGLALDAGNVIIGYGGNAGDCGSYHGWLVAAPESGGALHTFEVDSASGENQGAIWASGNAPAIDSSGDVWTSTGNGSSSSWDYQESVVKLDSSLNVLDHWAPSDWSSLDMSDTDIGSSMPLLLPSGLVFQIGKSGIGYLLSAAGLGGTGAAPVYQASVCSGSWGGGIYSGGVIYVACSNGMHALSLNASAKTFAPVSGWTVNGNANGPPIAAGGLIWSAGWNNGLLYALDPGTGATRFSASLGGFDHFVTPSAGGGSLFVASHNRVTAFQIASAAGPTPAPGPGPGPTPAPAPPQSASSSSAPSSGNPLRATGAVHAVAPRISRLSVSAVHRKLRLSMTLSTAARVSVAVYRAASGRTVRHRCRPGAKRGRRCQALVRKATLTLSARRGQDSFILRMPALSPGRYLVTVTAVTPAGGRSKRYTVAVTVRGR